MNVEFNQLKDCFAGIYNGKRVLVTGHTGFKGAWLSQWLIELGADVQGLSLYVPSSPALFYELGWSGRLKNPEIDIRNEKIDQILS